jgi:hypothetical protein
VRFAPVNDLKSLTAVIGGKVLARLVAYTTCISDPREAQASSHSLCRLNGPVEVPRYRLEVPLIDFYPTSSQQNSI